MKKWMLAAMSAALGLSSLTAVAATAAPSTAAVVKPAQKAAAKPAAKAAQKVVKKTTVGSITCKDGSKSAAKTTQGACSGHGGIKK